MLDPTPISPDLAALAADVAVIQGELETHWVRLTGNCRDVADIAERFAKMTADVTDKDEWTALVRRSGLAGIWNTLNDFQDRLLNARDDLTGVLEFDNVGDFRPAR